MSNKLNIFISIIQKGGDKVKFILREHFNPIYLLFLEPLSQISGNKTYIKGI